MISYCVSKDDIHFLFGWLFILRFSPNWLAFIFSVDSSSRQINDILFLLEQTLSFIIHWCISVSISFDTLDWLSYRLNKDNMLFLLGLIILFCYLLIHIFLNMLILTFFTNSLSHQKIWHFSLRLIIYFAILWCSSMSLINIHHNDWFLIALGKMKYFI